MITFVDLIKEYHEEALLSAEVLPSQDGYCPVIVVNLNVENGWEFKGYIAGEFKTLGWDAETEIPLGTGKSDYCDLSKNSIFIEQEYSRFEMFFRDFFRFLLLHDERMLDIGVLITYDDSAFTRWGSGVSSYRAARASLGKVVDFLEGKYSAVVRVPIWCIGIE